jgi:hypothetical protein
MMCRNIRTLFHFEPPATDEEIRAAALQYVRKVSGIQRPSRINEAVFEQAVEAISGISRVLIDALTPSGQPRNREEEAARAKARSAARFGRQG